jgi:chemotaxis protein methyltransferase CheR
MSSGHSWGAGLKPITDAEFRLFRDLIYGLAGIHLADVKKALLTGRLSRRLRELGMVSFRQYYDHVVADKTGQEGVFLLDAITTNETHFFREPKQFEYLQHELVPEWEAQAERGQRRKHIRIWSAACSSGEEPYSLAMMLLHALPPETGWQIEILATDISTRILDRARSGIWPIHRADSIPSHLLKKFMLRGTGSQQGNMKAGAEVRSVIQFARLNLNDAHYPVTGVFDAIFCRNVLIYFDQQSRGGVIGRMMSLLGSGGHLFLGHAESLTGMSHRMKSVAPAVYRMAAVQHASA